MCLSFAELEVFAQRLRGLPPGLDQRLNAGGHGSGHQGAQGAEPTELESPDSDEMAVNMNISFEGS